MMAFLSPFRNYIIAGAIAVILCGFAFSYIKGRVDGKNALLAKLTADKVQILKDGKEIDEKILSADDDFLCSRIGGCSDGVPDN